MGSNWTFAVIFLLIKQCLPQSTSYGVDISWPIHHSKVSENYQGNSSTPVQVLGNRQAVYDNFMQGCHDYYTPGTLLYQQTHDPSSSSDSDRSQGFACDMTEHDRIQMNLRQPASMQNYTTMGFHKIKCPSSVFSLIKSFWDANSQNKKREEWFLGNTYTNHWESPTYMVSVENAALRGGGAGLKKAIWDSAKETIEEWTGQKLTECSLYGIRIYEDGAILSPHVDRLPLVSSAIINVAQDVDEPWPLEVYGHDGKAYNVTMEPGDMVLYESHSVVHGRPFPLKGRFYANVFIHFEPVGHTLRHEESLEQENTDLADPPAIYDKATGKRLPPYIVPDSPQAAAWLSSNPDGWTDPIISDSDKHESFSDAHAAAQQGDLETLQSLHEQSQEEVHKEDANGWQPLHEAARAGHTHVVKFLVEDAGAFVNHRTNHGKGGTPLYWARHSHPDDHPVIDLLTQLGALDIGPDL